MLNFIGLLNVPRLICLSGAIAAFIFGMRAHTNEQQALLLQERIVQREQTIADIKQRLQEETARLEEAERRAQEALEGFKEELEEAKQAEAAWRERYNQIPSGCRAAIEHLDASCPALKY